MSSGAIAAVFVLATIPIVVYLSFRRVKNMPGYAEIQRFPLKERWRLGKLARSETYINHRGDSQKAEELMRASKRLAESQFTPRHVFIMAGVLVLPRLVGGVDLKEILLFGGLTLALVLGYMWNRKSTAAVKRTAEINGWDLEGPVAP